LHILFLGPPGWLSNVHTSVCVANMCLWAQYMWRDIAVCCCAFLESAWCPAWDPRRQPGAWGGGVGGGEAGAYICGCARGRVKPGSGRALPQCPTVAVSRAEHCHSAPRSLCLGPGTTTVSHGQCVSVWALLGACRGLWPALAHPPLHCVYIYVYVYAYVYVINATGISKMP
jgi:hypothetical protein